MSSFGAKEEIKLKTDIVSLISEYTRVKKAGASFMAVCPFHQEKSPSLHVSPDKGMWYCHGCGEGGDAFGFIMRMEGLDFRGAMQFLAGKAGVTLPEYDTKEQSERELLTKVNGAAARFYHETLRKSSVAAAARAYVAKRQLTDQTQEEFQIGYSPDAWDAILNFLAQKGVTAEQAAKAGLASRSERGSFFDRFRNRLMFPIRDHNGHTVGFTARVLPGPDGKDPKDEAKYVNTSQTLIYNKSNVLFGLDMAKQEIKKKNLAVVVEGNMDVIASHQAGVRNVVGSSGTSFTGEQLTLLKRFCDRLVLSFDNDAAGETAARRSIDAAVAHGFSVRILRMADGVKDPDDCIKQGVPVWEKAIADAVPYMDWYIGLARSRTNLRDPDSVRTSSEGLLKEVAKLAAPAERQFWLREIAQLFDTPESVLFEQVQKMRGGSAKPMHPDAPQHANKKPALSPRGRMTRHGLIAQHVLGLALQWPELSAAVVSEAQAAWMGEQEELFTAYSAKHVGADAMKFASALDAEGRTELAERAAVLAMLAEKEFGALTAEGRTALLPQLLAELRQQYKATRQRELMDAMHDAEKKNDRDAIADISGRLAALTTEK